MAEERSARRGGPVDQIVNRRDAGEDGWANGKPTPPGIPSGDADYFGNLKKFSNHAEGSVHAPNRSTESDWKPRSGGKTR